MNFEAKILRGHEKKKRFSKRKMFCNIFISFKKIDLEIKTFHTSAVCIALEFYYLICCDLFEIFDVTEKDY